MRLFYVVIRYLNWPRTEPCFNSLSWTTTWALACECQVKEFVRAQGLVLCSKSLDSSVQPLTPIHDCCSHCAVSCNISVKKPHVQLQSDVTKQRDATDDEREMLAKIRLHCGKCSRAFKGMDCFISHDSISYGFSRQLINGVVNKWQFLFVFDDILRTFPVFSPNKTLCTLELIQKILWTLLIWMGH